MTKRLLIRGGSRPLLLEEVNGESDGGARASSCAKEAVTGLNHLARCLVVPRCILVEQLSELVSQLLAGVGGKVLFLFVHGIAQVVALVIVEKESLAAGVERVVDSIVGLGLLSGLDRTSLQVVFQVFHSEWDAGLKGLLSVCLGECVPGSK